MTGGEFLILTAIALVIVIIWRESRDAEYRHQELLLQIDRAILRRGATD